MKSQLIILVVGIFLSAQLMAQNQMSNWFFSDSIHIKFTEDTIEVGSLPVYSSDLTASTNRNYAILSDSLGDVVLYKDSYFIYDNSGDVLNEDLFLFSSPLPNASVIIPVHDSSIAFVLNWDHLTGRIGYCQAELSEDEGDYNLNYDNCNTFIDEDSTIAYGLRLMTVKHGNGEDWWVITKVHALVDSLQPFSVRLFSDSEFNSPSLIYTDSTLDSKYFQDGRMVLSEDGSKIAIENGKDIKIYAFDRCSGEVFFDCLIPIIPNYLLKNVSFSQTGNFLYVASEGADLGGINGISKIWQFDIGGSSTCEELEESKQLVYEEPESYYGWDIGDMLLERNTGRIYFSIVKRYLAPGDDTVTGPQNLHLHAIMEPDLPGELCNVQENVLYLNGLVIKDGLPNMPNYALGALEGSPCDTLNETNPVAEVTSPSFKAFPNPVQDYLYIDNPLQTTCRAVVYNAMGQEVEYFIVQPGGQTLSTTTWPTGIYQLIIQQENEVIWRQSVVRID